MWIFILSLLVKTSESCQVGVKLKYFLVYVFSCHLSLGKGLSIAVEHSRISSFCRWPFSELLALTDLFSIYPQEADPWLNHWGAKPPKINLSPVTLCGDVLTSSMEKQLRRASMTDQRSSLCLSHPDATLLFMTQPTDAWLCATQLIQQMPSQYHQYSHCGEHIMFTASIQPVAARTDALTDSNNIQEKYVWAKFIAHIHYMREASIFL